MSVAAVSLPPCPRPTVCPVEPARVLLEDLCANAPDRLPVADLAEGEEWARVYSSVDGHAGHNPGVGSTRFAPFPPVHGAAAAHMVPTMYLARTLRTALLETVFHAVDMPTGGTPKRTSLVSGNNLLGRLHARLTLPRDVRMLDLRNPALTTLGQARESVVSSSALHYPCTRRIAQLVHEAVPATGDFDGILWHSRQTELSAMTGPVPAGGAGSSGAAGGAAEDEVAVLFGTRVAGDREGGWELAEAPDSSGSLFEGAGWQAVSALSVDLGITLDANIDGS